MDQLSNLTTALFLLAWSFFVLFYGFTHLSNNEVPLVRSVIYKNSEPKAPNTSKSDMHRATWRTSGFPTDRECTVDPESRFDCGRDRVLSQGECEDRGCCFSPLPTPVGPPWCFYPRWYPGYKMGPFSPSRRGESATLTRTKPSYLTEEISTLTLEVMEESAECLHLTVSALKLIKVHNQKSNNVFLQTFLI